MVPKGVKTIQKAEKYKKRWCSKCSPTFAFAESETEGKLCVGYVVEVPKKACDSHGNKTHNADLVSLCVFTKDGKKVDPLHMTIHEAEIIASALMLASRTLKMYFAD